MTTLSFDQFVKQAGGTAKDVQVLPANNPVATSPVSPGVIESTKALYGGSENSIGQKLINQNKQAVDELNGPTGVTQLLAPTKAVFRGVGDIAGAVFHPIGLALDKITGGKLNEVFTKLANTSPSKGSIIDKITDNPEVQKFVTDNPNMAEDFQRALNILFLGQANATEPTVNTLIDRTKAQVNPIIDGGTGAIGTIKDKVLNTIDTIENTGRKFMAPEVSEATKVSLNPTKALAGTGQDIQVSVGGKLKNLSEITPTENTKLQVSTAKSLENFTKQAELFSKDRSVKGGSPVEIVGNRVDSALDFANKQRQIIGKKMGEIETKYVQKPLPIGKKTLNTFTETLKSIDNPKYGVDTAEAPIVKKLVSDFDNLEKGGATIGERLDFVRSWDKYLNDAKDSFGKFKENATVNTRIQNAIRVLKDETVDSISTQDKVYRGLRSQYRTFKQLDEIGDNLLGKDGALGQRIKGAATVKRAIQSNSDAGARQFLAKLKELTGYDAIKEGDIALTAMENVGDYQGLSLLNVLKEGKGGIAKRAVEFARDKIVGNNATRIVNYIKK